MTFGNWTGAREVAGTGLIGQSESAPLALAIYSVLLTVVLERLPTLLKSQGAMSRQSGSTYAEDFTL